MLARTGLVLAMAAAGAHAHCGWTGFYINGVSVGDGTAMRMSNNPAQANYPLKYDSEDVACNVNGKNGVARTATAKDGDTLSFECRSAMDDVTNTRGDGPIARGHWGPCAIYAKKVDDAVSDPGVGSGWFKLWEDGYDEGTGQWCNERFIDAGGFLSIKLPPGLQGGDYLFRPEILALHAAASGDPQFYAGCAQVHLESTGNLVPKDTVSIPGWVSGSDPGVAYNLYKYPKMDLPYPIPGPSVVELVPGVSKASVQTSGLKPEGCIMENANWCGKEVPSYSSQDGCWSSAQNCWDQADECWSTAPPTGGANCETWGQYCKSIGSQCESGNWNGPSNAGKNMSPSKRTIQPTFWGSGQASVGEGTANPISDSTSPSTESGTDAGSDEGSSGEGSDEGSSEGYDSGSDSGYDSGSNYGEASAEAQSEPTPSEDVEDAGAQAVAVTPAPVAAYDPNVVTVTVTAYTTVTVDSYVTVD